MRRPVHKQISVDCSTVVNKCMVTPVLSRWHIVQIKEKLLQQAGGIRFSSHNQMKQQQNNIRIRMGYSGQTQTSQQCFCLRKKIINQMLF